MCTTLGKPATMGIVLTLSGLQSHGFVNNNLSLRYTNDADQLQPNHLVIHSSLARRDMFCVLNPNH